MGAQHIAVLGFGVTGQSVARHLLQHGTKVTVLDTRARQDIPDDLQACDYLWSTQRWPELDVDYVVVSPGLSMTSCLVTGARNSGQNLRSDIDLFCAAAQAPIIGITGTNGKSTVTSWVGHVLQTAGLNVGVGGNLGTPALSLLAPERQCYVLELSSFQLERSDVLPLHAAVVLNVSDDHLDQHGSLDAYAAVKQRIFVGARFVLSNRADDFTRPGPQTDAAERRTFGPDAPQDTNSWGVVVDAGARWLAQGERLLIPEQDLALRGDHNLINAMVTAALSASLVPIEDTLAGLTSFVGLSHRFEHVASVGGIEFIDDSKATNVGAARVALASLPAAHNVILIAGGDAKGADLSALAPELTGRVKLIVTMGKDGSELDQLANDLGINSCAVDSMPLAVLAATEYAVPGDVVLLAPACSSLDMFRNYEDRGAQFQAGVAQFAKGSADRGGMHVH